MNTLGDDLLNTKMYNTKDEMIQTESPITNSSFIYQKHIHPVNEHTQDILMDNNVKGIRGRTGKLVYHPIIMEVTQMNLLTTTFMRGNGACCHNTCCKRSHMSSELSHTGRWPHYELVDQLQTQYCTVLVLWYEHQFEGAYL